MSSSPGSAVSRRARPPPRATVQMSPAYTKAIESRDMVGNRGRRVAAASSGSAAPGDRATKRALRMMRAAQIGGTERGDGARRIAGSLVVGAPRFYSLYRPGVKSFRVHAAPGPTTSAANVREEVDGNRTRKLEAVASGGHRVDRPRCDSSGG